MGGEVGDDPPRGSLPKGVEGTVDFSCFALPAHSIF